MTDEAFNLIALEEAPAGVVYCELGDHRDQRERPLIPGESERATEDFDFAVQDAGNLKQLFLEGERFENLLLDRG